MMDPVTNVMNVTNNHVSINQKNAIRRFVHSLCYASRLRVAKQSHPASVIPVKTGIQFLIKM